MNARFPLTAKILTWFSLNLLVLMLLVWLGLRYATRSGFDSFLAGHVGGRVEATARAIMAELETKPRAEWNDILARYGQAHGVKFLLLGNDQETLAGEAVDLPETLRSQLPRPPRGGPEFSQVRRGPPQGEFSESTEFSPRGEPGGEGRGFVQPPQTCVIGGNQPVTGRNLRVPHRAEHATQTLSHVGRTRLPESGVLSGTAIETNRDLHRVRFVGERDFGDGGRFFSDGC